MEGKIKQNKKTCHITIYYTPSTLSFDDFFHPNFSAISRICLIATTNVISKYLLSGKGLSIIPFCLVLEKL